MKETASSRRQFLVGSGTGFGAAWLAAHWSEIAAAHQHARAAAAAGTPEALQSFTPDEAREIEAVAAQILPADETPGAREAGVLYFIDRALATFARDTRPVYKKGLRMLRGKSAALGAARFSDLPPERQIELLKSIEKTPFFETVHFHTIAGFFGSPEHGGNRDLIGWKLIQFEDEPSFEPPFGWYDANVASDRK
jgi:gluconate 2-dehydrogenase gamma chain